MVDVEKSFKNIVKKGSVVFGQRQSKLVVDNGSAKLMVLSDNCPFSEELRTHADAKKIPVYQTKVNSVELGALCGKTFAVSVFTITDDGGTNIVQMMKKR